MPRIGRGFPPQWIEPSPLGGGERALGPDPPQAILSQPTLRVQTITVASFAARYRRAADSRCFPFQGWTDAESWTSASASGNTNNAEGGANGVTPTTTDNGSGASWNAVTVNGNGSLAYSNVAPAHGSLGYQYACGASAGQASMGWTHASLATGYGRAYVSIDSTPSVGTKLVQWMDQLGGISLAYLQLNNTGRKWTIRNGADSSSGYVSTTALQIGHSYRFEWAVTPAGGGFFTVQVRLYDGDSTTPLEDSGAVLVAAASGTPTTMSATVFGLSKATANAPTSGGFVYLDDLVAGAVTWPGPYIASNLVSVLTARFLGPRPPVLFGPPPPVVTTLTTAFATAQARRQSESRRFPWQGWSGDSPGANGAYASIVNQAGPTAYWRLDEASGPAADSSGNGNTGSYNGTVKRAQPGLLAGDSDASVGLVRGVNSTVTVRTAGAPYLAGQTQWTFECWLESTGFPNSNMTLWNEQGSGNDRVLIAMGSTGGAFSVLQFFYKEDNGTTDVFSSLGGATLTDGGAHHVVVTRNGNQIQSFVNGVLIGTLSPTLGPQTDATFTAAIGDNSGSLASWQGPIDEVAIYQRALSSTEIAAHYRAGAANVGGASVLIKRNLGPTPPRLILPLPSQSQQTISATTAAENRIGIGRHFPLQGWDGGPNSPNILDPYQATVLADSPTNYWRFRPGSFLAATTGGVNLTNSGGGAQAASLLNDPTDASVQFASGGYLNGATHPALNTGTVELWVQRTRTGTLEVPFTIYNGGFQIRIQSNDTLALAVDFGNIVATSTLAITDTNPHHVVISRNGAGGEVRITLDGVTQVGTPGLAFSTAFAPSTNGVFIGSQFGTVPLVGNVDEAAIYDGVVLSDAQRVEHYKAGLVGFAVAGLPGFNRLLGPRLPLLISFALVFEAPQTPLVSIRAARPRKTTYDLFGFVPQVSAKPPPPLHVALVRTRPRRTLGTRLAPPIFRPQADYTLAVSVIRTRPRPTVCRLGPPLLSTARPSYQQATVAAYTVRTRPRHTRVSLPLVIRSAAAFIAAPISTNLVVPDRIERRRFNSFLAPPTTLRTFAGPRIALIHTRPRRTVARVLPPATLEPETVALRERQIRAILTRTRPRRTVGTKLSYVVYRATSKIKVALVRTRPRPTRPTLEEPIFYAATSRISVLLVRSRPRPTIHRLAAVRYAQAGVGFAHLVRTRPRPTTSFVSPPATLQPYAVTVSEDTIRTALARTRPRPTVTLLSPPTALRTFAAGTAALARTRPMAMVAFLAPPATLEPESVALSERQIRTPLVRTRPRPTASSLTAVTYPATSEIAVSLVRTRPQPTRRYLTAVRYPQADYTLAVSVVRTRPRPTTSYVLPPATLTPYVVEVAEETVRTQLARTRPRPTVAYISPPVVLATFEGASVALVRSRPRPTRSVVEAPRVVRVPSVEQRQRTISVSLVRTRPRPTDRFIREPLVKTFPPVVTALLPVHLVRSRPRPTTRRLAPPTVVAPLPTLRMQTVSVALARVRPRPTAHRLAPPTSLLTFRAASVSLARARPRPTRHLLVVPATLEPEPVALAERTIRTVLARTRLRATVHRLAAITYPASGAIRVALARTRPRPTSHRVAPPTVVTRPTFAAAPAHLARTRPRRTTGRISPPAVVFVATGPPLTTALIRTRPRRTSKFLAPPATLRRVAATLAPPLLEATVTTRPPVTRALRIDPHAAPLVPPTPGFVTGYVIATTGGSGEAVGTTGGDGQIVPSSGGDGEVVRVAASEGEVVPTSGASGRTKRSGSP